MLYKHLLVVRKDLVVVDIKDHNKLDHINKTISLFKDIAIKQGEKGMEKYGQALDPRDKKHDWLFMLLEELVDGIQYAVAEILRRDEIINEVREIIRYNTIPMVHDQLTVLLDELEGLDENDI